MRNRSFVPVLLLLVLMVPTLVACSGAGGPKEVRVTLTDYGIQSSVSNFKVGVPYHFVVENKGDIAHEIMLMEPMDTPAGMDMEEMDEMALANVEADDLPAGGKATFDYTFAEPAGPGDLEFACHVTGHYEKGMRMPITVTE